MQLWVMRRSQGLLIDTGAKLANAGEMHRSKILRRKREPGGRGGAMRGDGSAGQWQCFVSC